MDTELIMLSGTAEAGIREITQWLLLEPGTAVLHHDLAKVACGVVRRRLRVSGLGADKRSGVPARTDHTETLELAHGCVSCTLRQDVLPQIRALAKRHEVQRVVLHLDPVLEPEQVCRHLGNVVIDGTPITADVRLSGVITVLDPASWLTDATSDQDVAERGLAALPDDQRTLAQLVVAQAEFADLLVYADSERAAEPWQRARANAVLARLTPLAPRIEAAELDPADPLGGLPATARRGKPDGPHAALLHGQPPLDEYYGVRLSVFTARRPFHPLRLHEAMDVLLDGVVRTRGRIWLATRPEAMLWLESAGGGLQIEYADQWLAADTGLSWAHADPERCAAAALRWHPRWKDRVQELAVLSCGADPHDIDHALLGALLTDSELAAGEAAWRNYPDPFGWHHPDPGDEPSNPTASNPTVSNPAPTQPRRTQ